MSRLCIQFSVILAIELQFSDVAAISHYSHVILVKQVFTEIDYLST